MGTNLHHFIHSHNLTQLNSNHNRNLLEMENDEEIEQKNTYRIKLKHNNPMIMIFTSLLKHTQCLMCKRNINF